MFGLGKSRNISVVPGNHDAYVREPWHRTLRHWQAFMPEAGTQPRKAVPPDHSLFPYLIIKRFAAIIGVSTALPTAPHLATGHIGQKQLYRLEKLLRQVAGRGLFRIIFLHHPPVSGVVRHRKRLVDQDRLQAIIRSYGCELVLHGHAHRSTDRYLSTPSGTIPVHGAPSATSTSTERERRAAWHLYRIEQAKEGQGFRVKRRVRTYIPDMQKFVWEDELNSHQP
jgi:3',5'-cyclic AMP phosphodiesterase CpdA